VGGQVRWCEELEAFNKFCMTVTLFRDPLYPDSFVLSRKDKFNRHWTRTAATTNLLLLHDLKLSRFREICCEVAFHCVATHSSCGFKGFDRFAREGAFELERCVRFAFTRQSEDRSYNITHCAMTSQNRTKRLIMLLWFIQGKHCQNVVVVVVTEMTK
jgi:hypothetical protein